MAHPKGHIPWNKGLKGIHLSPNSEFKKGCKCPMEGKKHSEISKLKMSLNNIHRGKTAWNKGLIGFGKGEENGRWIKDRSQLVKSEKKHLDGKYREWMFSVKKRDGWKCRILNSDCKGRIEAHHILSWRDYPLLRHEINNGITLCHAHHPHKRAEEKRLSPYFQDLVSVSN